MSELRGAWRVAAPWSVRGKRAVRFRAHRGYRAMGMTVKGKDQHGQPVEFTETIWLEWRKHKRIVRPKFRKLNKAKGRP